MSSFQYGQQRHQLNYALLSIPAYYVFSVVPHMYANAILASNGYKYNNANPKASLSPANVKGKVPDAVFRRYQRAENAQANNLEQMPLFFAAVLASLMAEQRLIAGLGVDGLGGAKVVNVDLGLMTFVGWWFVVRSAYVLAYIVTESHQVSFIRSGMWAGGTGLAVWQIWKAAGVL